MLTKLVDILSNADSKSVLVVYDDDDAGNKMVIDVMKQMINASQYTPVQVSSQPHPSSLQNANRIFPLELFLLIF